MSVVCVYVCVCRGPLYALTQYTYSSYVCGVGICVLFFLVIVVVVME